VRGAVLRAHSGVALALLAACGGHPAGSAARGPGAELDAESDATERDGPADAGDSEEHADADMDARAGADADADAGAATDGDAAGDGPPDATQDGPLDAPADHERHDAATCTPLTCDELADAGVLATCRPVSAGCGQKRVCAPCGAGTVCQAGSCVACSGGPPVLGGPPWPSLPPVAALSLATGDVNGDGAPDLVVGGTGALATVLGNGDGTFAQGIVTTTSASASYVATADLDGDGNADVVATDPSGAGAVLAYLSDGHGGFLAGAELGHGQWRPTLADVNGDGATDVLVGVDKGLAVRLGAGDGTFGPEIVTPSNSAAYPAVVADVNGDGLPDVVGFTDSGLAGSGRLQVLLGDGSGSFTAVKPLGGYVQSIAGGDFDGDGKEDLLTTTFDNVTRLSLGNGDGTFGSATVVYDSKYYVSGVRSADVDGDGKPDAIVGLYGTYPGVQVLFGAGDGTFSAPVVADGPMSSNLPLAALADFNRDGVLDVPEGVGATSVGVALSTGPRSFDSPPAYPLGGPPGAGCVADFDRDGNPDVAFAIGTSPGSVSVLLGRGDATLRRALTTPLHGYLGGIAAGDLDGDGLPDLVVADGGALDVLLGNGDGTFRSAPAVPTGELGVALADMNGDGHLDIVGAGSLAVDVFLGAGDGTFGARASYPVSDGYKMYAVAVGDFNGDGHPDVVAGSGFYYSYVNTYLQVLLGSATGALTGGPAVELQDAASMAGLAVADLDGDGLLDVAMSGTEGYQMYVAWGLGGDRLSPPVAVGPVNGRINGGLAVADVDGDGRLDLATTDPRAAQSVSVLLGVGGRAFEPRAFPGGDAPSTLVSVDLDSDGRPDLVVADRITKVVSVVHNEGCKR